MRKVKLTNIRKLKYYTYKITNLINSKIYIGKSTTTRNRWGEHKKNAIHQDKDNYFYIHKSINKYGVENFTFEALNYFVIEDDAYDDEERLIKLYNSNNSQFGMNLNSGGRRFKQSEATKLKISLSNTGKKEL